MEAGQPSPRNHAHMSHASKDAADELGAWRRRVARWGHPKWVAAVRLLKTPPLRMAISTDRAGFEPAVERIALRRFSKPVPSAARSPVQYSVSSGVVYRQPRLWRWRLHLHWGRSPPRGMTPIRIGKTVLGTYRRRGQCPNIVATVQKFWANSPI